MFFCDNITAFGSFVVPDVNNIIDISFGFTFTSSYFLSPFFTNLVPSSSKSLNFSISLSSISSIQINIFRFVLSSFFIFFITSRYFLSNIATSASLLFTKLSISLSGKALSNGTTTIFPVVVAKYVIHHSYLLFPIRAILLPSKFLFNNKVENALISFPTCSYVFSTYSTSFAV